MKLRSLKTKITFLLLSTLIIAGLTISIGLYSYSHFKKNTLIKSIQNQMKSSVSAQSQKLLMPFLVKEQQSGLKLLLNKYKKQEGLNNAEIIVGNELPDNFKDCALGSEVTTCISQDGNSVAVVSPIQASSKVYGYFFKSKALQLDAVGANYRNLIFVVLIVLFMTFIILFVLLARIASVDFPRSLDKLAIWLEKVLNDNDQQDVAPDLTYKEFSKIENKISEIVKRHKEAKQEIINLQKKIVSEKVAQQVAHDIRSPLAALSVVASDLKELPEDKRLRIVSAVRRINDIANDLSLKGSDKGQISERSSIYLLSSLTESLVSEKRIQYRSQLNTEIVFNPSYSYYGLFAKINPAEFKRVLSNLINNSVEALDQGGKVIVSLDSNEGEVTIKIQDTGRGIPAECMPELTQKGYSYEKKTGSGLGLYYVKTNVEAWGGRLLIESEQGTGTTAIITVPRLNPPKWFVPELKIYEGDTIVVLDDDQTIHQIWESRFKDIQLNNVTVEHFTTFEEVSDWYQNQRDLTKNTHYLFDYELIGQGFTGLEIIEDLGIKNNAILVTSHFENIDIIKKCEELNVKMIPKGMAGFVPIKLEKLEQSIEYVLIDDDEMTRSTWLSVAKIKGKKLAVFETPNEFYSQIDKFTKETSIYLDSHLSNGVQGEVIGKELSIKGFKRIYLTTGSDKTEFPPMPWIKDIVGKTPPFFQ